MCTGRLEQAAQMAGRHPQTQVVIDHLGLPQPQEPPAPAAPFADLPTLLALAAHANVAVKISGACTLSHAPFPYQDIWDPLWRIFDAFGLHRCLWGTDWTRAVKVVTSCGQKTRSHISNHGYPWSDARLTRFLMGAEAGCLSEILTATAAARRVVSAATNTGPANCCGAIASRTARAHAKCSAS
jgi:hypothetical protein